MDPLSVFGLIQAGGSLLGNVVGNIFGSASQQKLTKENMLNAKELADYQYYLQQKQFDYTNKYNLPANQVKRLIQADLNPNLAYSSGSVVGSTASMPSVSQPHANMSDPMALAQYQLQMANMFKDLALQGAQIAKVKEETKGLSLDNQEKEQTLDTKVSLQRAIFAERDALARIAENNFIKQVYDRNLQRDIYNVKQLILRGADAELQFQGLSFDPDEDIEAKNRYVADLSESDLYNSIKALWVRDPLQVQELNKKLKILDGEIQRLPYLATKLQGEALVSKFQGELAQNGISPNDPIWARALLVLIAHYTNTPLSEVLPSFGKAAGVVIGSDKYDRE